MKLFPCVLVVATLIAGLATQAEAASSTRASAAKASSAKATVQLASLLGDASCCQPAPAACEPKCCYNPCIQYRHALFCRKVCCGCEPDIKTVLKVKDPCTCCVVDVPVCLPGCCKGEPEVCSKCGCLGRGHVRYDYCCGVSVVVTFKKCGDVLVTYRGA